MAARASWGHRGRALPGIRAPRHGQLVAARVREVESQAAHDALGLLAVEPVAEGDHGLGHVAALDEGELPQ